MMPTVTHRPVSLRFGQVQPNDSNRPGMKDRMAGLFGVGNEDGDEVNITAHNPVINDVNKDQPVELLTLLKELVDRAPETDWSRWSSNLEGKLKTEFGEYTVRLSRDHRTIPNYALYDLQVFSKGFFSSKLVFDLKAVGEDIFPIGLRLAKAYDEVVKSMPELKMDVPDANKNFRIFQMGDTQYTLSYATPKTVADPALSQQLPQSADWVLLVRKADSLSVRELKRCEGYMGYVDAQGFHPLDAARTQAIHDEWTQVLAETQITEERVIHKGNHLFKPRKGGWSFF